MLWPMFCWESWGPGIHIDITLTRTQTLLHTVQVKLFMALVLSKDSDLFQKDNVFCHTEQTWPPDFLDFNPIEHLCDVLDKQV